MYEPVRRQGTLNCCFRYGLLFDALAVGYAALIVDKFVPRGEVVPRLEDDGIVAPARLHHHQA